MKQHYLPQFYLRYFTAPNKPSQYAPYVWTFQSGEWKKKSPDNIAYGADFYAFEDEHGNIDHRFEDSLQKLESLIAPALKRVSETIPVTLNDSDRMYLAWFLVSLEQRTPDYLNARAMEMELAIRENYRHQYQSFVRDPQKFDQFKESNGFGNFSLADVTPENFEKWDVKPVKAYLLSEAVKQWELLANVIFSMRWTILFSHTPVFVTSESPVVTMVPHADGDGWTYGDLGHPNVDISLPLTPKLALMCHWRGDENYRLVEATENDIRTLNLRTINSAADALTENSAPLEIIAASPTFPFSEIVEAVTIARTKKQ